MKITEYKIKNNNFDKRYVFALISDLHGEDPIEAAEAVKSIAPDFILAPGDIFEPLDSAEWNKENQAGFELLCECSKIAPTFFCPGNHELGGVKSWSLKWKLGHSREKCYAEESLARIKESGAIFLDDSYTLSKNIAFGGLTSALIRDDKRPDIEALSEFFASDNPKVLLCHHPEYYEKYLKDKDVDLIVSGHAHGGQWRIFGRGVFAPGQGLFPKYTSGVHDDRFIVGRGLKKSGKIPRIFNPPEVVKIVIYQ